MFFKFNFPLPVPSRSYSYCSLIYPHILFLSLCHSFSARSWWLVVPSLQMAHSDHLLMTGEQRKAFPAAAAWHPIHCASAHAHTHARTQRLKYLNNDSDPYMHAVIGFKPYRTQTFFFFLPFAFFLQCHTFLHCCRLMLGMILCCTFAQFPSPLSSCLQLSSFHLLLWCYWLCHTGTDRRRGRGWGGQCATLCTVSKTAVC